MKTKGFGKVLLFDEKHTAYIDQGNEADRH